MVSPVNIISTAPDALATLIANSTNWQTWTGTNTVNAAKARIFIDGLPPSITRPFAGIMQVGKVQVSRLTGAYASGQLDVMFEDSIASINQASYTDSTYAFANNMGAVLNDVITLADTLDGALLIRDIQAKSEIMRSSLDEIPDYLQQVWTVTWGLND